MRVEEPWALGPFEKTAEPVLRPMPERTFRCPVRGEAVCWAEKDVFNPAAVVRGGKVHLLFRAEDAVAPHVLGTSRVGLAVSDDGFHFTCHPEPVLYPDRDDMLPYEWEAGCEDPRVVETEEDDPERRYVMTYTACDGTLSRLAVATSPDLVKWTKRGLAFAGAHGGRYRDRWGKSGAVVCRRNAEGRPVAARVNGRYWMYWGEGTTYAAVSDDLVRWEPVEFEANENKVARADPAAGRWYSWRPPGIASALPVLRPRAGRFDSALTEPGPFALLTDAGIVLPYNASNSGDDARRDPSLPAAAYAPGQVLFDPLDPLAVIGRTATPFLRPDLAHETAGQTRHTVFAEGLVHFGGRWLLYYGGGDSVVSVAVSPGGDE
jgi:predicted GH43/DUF377 family glycosyl hydrolase